MAEDRRFNRKEGRIMGKEWNDLKTFLQNNIKHLQDLKRQAIENKDMDCYRILDARLDDYIFIFYTMCEMEDK